MIAVSKCAMSINFISMPTETVILKAFETYSQAFRYIGVPTEEQKYKVISMDPKLIDYIVNPDKDLILKAFESYPDAYKCIYNPTLEMDILAVTRKPELIRYIEFPTEEVQMIAVKANPFTLGLINFLTKKVVEVARNGLKNILDLVAEDSLCYED